MNILSNLFSSKKPEQNKEPEEQEEEPQQDELQRLLQLLGR
jgi:hypothetical protein